MPVFISVDPERDTVEQVREYVKGTATISSFKNVHFIGNWEGGKSALAMRFMSCKVEPTISAFLHFIGVLCIWLYALSVLRS